MGAGSDSKIILEADLKEFISKKFAEMERNVTGSVDKMIKKSKGLGKQQDKLNKKTSGLAKGITSFAKRFGPAALVVGGLTVAMRKLAQGMAFVRDKTEGFEATMSTVEAIVAKSSAELTILSEKARALGESTVFSAIQSGEAFVELGKLGFTTNEILTSTASVLDVAAASMTDLSTAAIVTAGTVRQFGLEASEAGKVGDIMAKSFNSSALDIDKFKESMKFVGATASSLGVSLESTTAGLAELSNKLISGSQAGTAMRRIMLELGDSSGKVAALIGKTAIATLTFQEKLKALQDKNLSPTEIKATFGLLASTSAGILIKGADNIESFTKVLKTAQGESKRMADIMLNNVRGATILLESAQEGLGITIGTSFGKDKQKRIQFYTKLINEASAMAKAHKAELEAIGNVLSLVLKVGAVVGLGLIKLFVGVIDLALAPFNLALFFLTESFLKLMQVAQAAGKFFGKEVFDPATIQAMKDVSNEFFEDLKSNISNAATAFTMQSFLDEVEEANKEVTNNWKATKEKLVQISSSLTEDEKKEIDKRKENALKVQNELKLLNLQDFERKLEELRQFEIAKRAILVAGGVSTAELEEQVKIRREFINSEKLAKEKVLQEQIQAIRDEFSLTSGTKEEQELERFKRNLVKKNQFLRKNNAEELKVEELVALKKISINKKIEDQKKKSNDAMLKSTLGNLASAFAGDKKFALLGKGIAATEATIQGILAVQKALATGGPFLGPVLAGIIGVTTAKNVSDILAQSFVTGGFPTGSNALIRVNENGQESVLNARATNSLGVGGVNALNSGQVPNTSITNQISYNPSITITGNATEGIITALSEDKENFARFFQDEIIEKGYLERG